MTVEEIATLVAESASRFGDQNPQQLDYLTSRLRAVNEATVAQGLLSVFTDGAAPPSGAAAQELAGRLLAALQPKAEINLRQILPVVLGRYELSVEQLPHYLASLFGSDLVLAELGHLGEADLSQRELQALQTMRFWLRE